MKKSQQLPPSNNKALFHSLAHLFAQAANDDISPEKAQVLCNIAGKMQKSLELEIDRVKANFIIGNTDTKIREIEITNPEA